MKYSAFGIVVFIALAWSTNAAANRASCLTGGDQGQTKLPTRPTSLVGNIVRSHTHRQHKLALGRHVVVQSRP